MDETVAKVCFDCGARQSASHKYDEEGKASHCETEIEQIVSGVKEESNLNEQVRRSHGPT